MDPAQCSDVTTNQDLFHSLIKIEATDDSLKVTLSTIAVTEAGEQDAGLVADCQQFTDATSSSVDEVCRDPSIVIKTELTEGKN